MAILSFYEGYSELSFGLFNNELDTNDYKLYRFPYTYSNNLFQHSFSREKFYKDVFTLAIKELGIDNYSLFNLGFLSVPELPFKADRTGSLFSLLDKRVIYVSSQLVALKGQAYSHMPLNSTFGDLNFRVNLDLYHNIIYYDSRDIVLKDSLLREIINAAQIQFDGEEYLIAGDRFREFDINPALSYLLIFDIIKNPGVYYLKIDRENLYPHSALMEYSSMDYPSIGTLVNVPGDVECLYETDLGTSQLFELAENNLFILPLDSGAEARILIKYQNATLEKKVRGGELGVIIDTRPKLEKTEFKEVYLNYISQSVNRI